MEDGFRARVGISDFGAMQATLLTTMPHSVHRSRKLIRQADPEVLKVGCIVRGGATVTQNGQRADPGVGDLMLFDTSRPFLGRHAPHIPTSQLLLLRFPRSLLPLPDRDLRSLNGVRIPARRASVHPRPSSCCSSPGTCTNSARPTPPVCPPSPSTCSPRHSPVHWTPRARGHHTPGSAR
ncbi:hypothetical protein [Streptomyces pseudovenezuelae]|uniref:AraC-like ligand-binding domain-containing protein n=1 Tax=Streptomyces pseudovenezuelae TaxID=67350 RepID=UPI003D7BB0D7